MSRTRRFVGGVSASYAYQIAVTVVGLWLTPFLLSRLGARDYGLWLTATQLMAYIALLDVGVLALLPREAAYATGRAGGVHAASGIPDLVGRTARIVLWQMPLIAAAALGVWLLVTAGWADLRVPLAILLTVFVVTYPLRLFQATLQGLQDLAFVGSVQLASWLLGTTVSVALVLTGWGLSSVAIGTGVAQFVSCGACAGRMAHAYPAALPRRLPRVSGAEALSYLKRALWVSLGQLAHVLSYGTDLIVVAWMFGPATVVPYACTQKLIAVLANQPQVLTQAAAPALSELRMGATREKLFTVTSSLSLALMMASGAAAAVALGANGAFVSWWVGADQYGGARLTAIFVAAMLLRHFNTALVYSLFSFGYERRLSITAVADGIVTLGLSALFAGAIGVVGVPLGFLGGALLVSIPANLAALARETGVSPAQFLNTLRPWAARLTLLLIAAGAANVLVRSGSLLVVLALAATLGAGYAALLLPFALRGALGEYLRLGSLPVLRLFRARPATVPAGAAPGDRGRNV